MLPIPLWMPVIHFLVNRAPPCDDAGMSSPAHYRRAYRALNGFYRRLVDDLADKVVDREDSFEETYLGLGEEIIERYGHLLLLTQHSLMGIHQAMGGEGEGPMPPVARVTSFTCPEEDIEGHLAQWLEENDDVEVINFQVLPGAEQCRCLLMYNSHRPEG